MANLYATFKKLIPNEPRLVGAVASVFTGGAVITLQSGATLRVLGEATVGQKVYVRGGVIEGPAPSLTLVEFEI